jgi:PAS domain S-box-containing protein
MFKVSTSSLDSRIPPVKPGHDSEAPLVVIDDIGNIIATTKEFCELSGYSPEDMGFQNWWLDLTPPESATRELFALGELEGMEGLQFFDKELIKADGKRTRIGVLARASHELFILEIARIFPCLSSARSPLYGFSGMLSMHRATIVTDLNGKITHANGCALSIIGFASEGDIIGCSVLQFIAPEFKNDFKRKIGRGREGASEDEVISLLRTDGDSVLVRVRSLPLIFRDAYHGNIDFVRLVPNEEKVLRSPGETSAQEEHPCRPPDCLDGLPVALCSLRPDGSIRFVNAFGRSFLGISDEDMQRGLFIFERLREGMVGRCRTMLDDALRGAEVRPIVMDIETPQGEYKPAIWCFAWDRKKDGLVCIILKASDLLASAMLPDEGFYASYRLTSREREVADLLILGFEYKEIADRMGISLPTVRSHAQGVYMRLSIHSRDELIELSGQWCNGLENDEFHGLIMRYLRTR